MEHFISQVGEETQILKRIILTLYSNGFLGGRKRNLVGTRSEFNFLTLFNPGEGEVNWRTRILPSGGYFPSGRISWKVPFPNFGNFIKFGGKTFQPQEGWEGRGFTTLRGIFPTKKVNQNYLRDKDFHIWNHFG